MTNSPDQDLDWLAFRYIADEMTDDERAAFEARLEQDQPAREAVAGSVELSQTLAAAEHLLESPVVASADRRAVWWRRVAWATIAGSVAVCITLAVVLPSAWEPTATTSRSGETNDSLDVESAASKNLATAWVATLKLEEDWRDEHRDTGLPSIAAAELLAVSEETPSGDSDWMATALAGLASEMGNENANEVWEN